MATLTTESTIYVTYIATTPEKCWEAITTSAFTKLYFFGRSVESGWKVGSEVIYRKPDGGMDVQGKILECDPPYFVRFTWRVDWIPELRHLPDSIVSYKIEKAGEGVVRFTMIEEHPEPIDARLLEGGRSGWPLILSGLKSVLETGKMFKANPAGPPPAMLEYIKELKK
jgi:uncharacterized protein YndB with AHSA1/START domain